MDSKIQEFKPGDKVRILRKAATHENKWENSWESVMDEAVGQTGTVISGNGKLRHDVHVNVPAVGSSFGYPSFVLELVSAKKEFKVGDKVRVTYGHGWDGDGVITGPCGPDYIVRYESGRTGGFSPKSLTLISVSVEPAPTKSVPAEPVPTLGGFKVGDRVYAPGRGEYKNPSTVTKIDSEFVYVKPDGSKNDGGFYPKSLKFVEVKTAVKTEEQAKYTGIAGAVKSHSKVFGIAKDLAVTFAKRSYGNFVHADLVQEELVKLGYTSTDLGNAAGALFRGKNWKRVQYRKSVRKGNHAREITVWQYVGA